MDARQPPEPDRGHPHADDRPRPQRTRPGHARRPRALADTSSSSGTSTASRPRRTASTKPPSACSSAPGSRTKASAEPRTTATAAGRTGRASACSHTSSPTCERSARGCERPRRCSTTWTTPSKPKDCASASETRRRSPGSTWQRDAARCSACSAPTGRARRRPSASSPPSSPPTRAAPGSTGTTSSATPKQVRETIGLTGQYASVDELLTGEQNLTMIGQLLNLSGKQAKARAKELLDWFDLTEAAKRPAKTYSGGMRRRLDLAASLVGRPSVIFLDEPTTGLDPSKREDMWSVVRSLVDDGSTVLLTTQYLEEADALADEITVIDKGSVIAHDTPDGLKRVVGGQRLTVRPVDPSRLEETAAIIGTLAGAPAEQTHRGVVVRPRHGRRGARRRRSTASARPVSRSPSSPSTSPASTRSSSPSPAAPTRRPRPSRRCSHERARAPPAQPRAGQTQPDRGPAQPRGAAGRDDPARHLHRAVHVHLRRRDRRRLPAGLPAVPAPGRARADGGVRQRRDRREPLHRHPEGRLRPLPQPPDRPRRAADRRRARRRRALHAAVRGDARLRLRARLPRADRPARGARRVRRS